MATRLSQEDTAQARAWLCCEIIILVPKTIPAENQLVCPECTQPLVPPVIPSKVL